MDPQLTLFIQHCAILIQSRFKGFVQRKKYKAFLPIYRRFKELLASIYLGWKIRRIMNLPKIKNQIIKIKEKVNNNQMSSSRIAKRQLIDDIQRLKKKGKWIEFLTLNKNKINNSTRQSNQ